MPRMFPGKGKEKAAISMEMAAKQNSERLLRALEAAKSLTITGSDDVDSLFEVVLKEMHELLECDRATLFLVDHSTKTVWSQPASAQLECNPDYPPLTTTSNPVLASVFVQSAGKVAEGTDPIRVGML